MKGIVVSSAIWIVDMDKEGTFDALEVEKASKTWGMSGRFKGVRFMSFKY